MVNLAKSVLIHGFFDCRRRYHGEIHRSRGDSLS